MKRLDTLDRTVTADGRELTLRHRDGDYFIDLDGAQLMSTRSHGSESVLAKLGCEGLRDASRPRVLVGGLGLGFTLRATLERLPADAEVVVVELFESVVRWNRQYLAGPDPSLEDPRVRLHVGDIAEMFAPPDESVQDNYDAILLDVDNGPEAWTLDSNDWLYGSDGIARLRRALRPGGVLALWSAGPDAGYVRRLEQCGLAVRQVRTRARRGQGARHMIFLARCVERQEVGTH